jgi:hypothetical protein
MASVGAHHAKTSKPGSETQRPHSVTHTQSRDKADKHTRKTQMMEDHLLGETGL